MSYSSYNSFITGITGSQFVLPMTPAVLSFTVAVQSGTAFVQGVPLFAGNQIRFGGYDTAVAVGGQSIAIGCTGGRTLIAWDAVNYR